MIYVRSASRTCSDNLAESYLYRNIYIRDSQPFGTCVPQNQNCTPLCSPKSELYPSCKPHIKRVTKMNIFWVVLLNFVYPCELLTYPMLRTADIYCKNHLLRFLILKGVLSPFPFYLNLCCLNPLIS